MFSPPENRFSALADSQQRPLTPSAEDNDSFSLPAFKQFSFRHPFFSFFPFLFPNQLPVGFALSELLIGFRIPLKLGMDLVSRLTLLPSDAKDPLPNLPPL